jgi:two-component system CheB/CheR fusion protein
VEQRSRQAPPLDPGQYQALVEHSPVMIWRAGLDAKCDYFNETWLAFRGRTLDQELGDGWAEGVHPEDLRRCLDVYLTSFEGRSSFEMEYRLLRHDGVYRAIFDRGVPFQHPDGSFAGYIGSCVDVEERRAVERQKASFLSMVAHELRTPLTSMKTYLQATQRRLARGQLTSLDILARLEAQLGRFEELVADMSDIAALDVGRPIPLDLAELDLVPLVRDGVAGRDNPGADRRHVIVVDAPPAPAPVRGDRRRLAQVLANLLENALKYSPRGGTIRVSLTCRGAEVEVAVSDEGIGVPRDEIDSLARPYFRARNAPSAHYPGLGLGLSIAREIVVRHGGRLWFESELGVGTTARFALPAAGGA